MSGGEDEHEQKTDAQADRAERLSRRRKDRSQSRGESSTDKTDNTDNVDETDDSDSADNTDSRDAADELVEPLKLSQNTKEQMMHLPADQHKRLHHLYTRMKADYEYEYDEAFEMNRHYFPLVLQYGLERFEERDVNELRQDLAEFGDDLQ